MAQQRERMEFDVVIAGGGVIRVATGDMGRINSWQQIEMIHFFS